MKRLCTICARAGSKGLKNKNIRPLLGKPLIAHTISHALEANLFDAIAVTSDSDLILEIARESGATYLIKRSEELATDVASKIPVIQHCLKEVEKLTGDHYDLVVDLDPTSPLRLISDIEEAVRLFEKTKVSNLISGTPAQGSPYFNLVEVDENGVARLSKSLKMPIFRRQDSPPCYDVNGSIYIWRRDALLKSGPTVFLGDTMLYVMPEERSIDIDTELDFEIVEFLLSKREALQANRNSL